MAFKAEDITINMSAGQRASALNHISVLRTALYGDSEKNLIVLLTKCVISVMKSTS